MANMITPNFSRSEMACRRGCGQDEMDQEFIRMLQAFRDQIGPMPVTSGFRSDAHNYDVSTVKNGTHTLAKAADILISGERGDAVVRKSPSDWLQWHRIEPERATSQAVHTSRYR